MSPRRFGRYELVDHLATGGMAEVWLARSFGVAGFEKQVVLKRILPELARSPRFVQQFVQEARISAGLVHPNIVQIYELGRVANEHYIAMEFVHGRDLMQVIRRLRRDGRSMPVGFAMFIVAGVLRGLAHAHSLTDSTGRPLRLVHRDVSPHNVLVGFEGEVKLFDFGIARLRGDAASDSPQLADGGAGKYAYMAPEQARGEAVDRRSDIYSAGLLLHELLTGRRVFRDEDPDTKLRRVRKGDVPPLREVCPEVSPSVCAVADQMLAASPDGRFERAEEAEEALRAVLYELGETADAAQLATWMRGTFDAEPSHHRMGVDVVGLAAEIRALRTRAAADNSLTTRSETSVSGLDELEDAAGECKSVVVVVVDVVGMTDLSRRADPEEVVRRNLRLLRRLRLAVGRHGGVVDRFEDDSLVVLFGLPRTGEDDLDRALACSQALQREAERFGRRDTRVRLAIGVHRGEVTVGRTRKRRHRYRSRGDTVKLARRISLTAEPGQILASGPVVELARERWRFEEGLALPARGGREQQTWSLHGRLRLVEGGMGGWVPRGAEASTLADALEALTRGGGGVLWIEGAGGYGKSRLVRELRHRARRRDVPLFSGRASTYGRDRPLAPFRDVVADALGIELADSADTIRHRLGTLAELGLSPRERRILASLFAVEVGGAVPRGRVGQVAEAAVTFVRGLSAERPLLMALEDVQHLTKAEQTLLAQVIDACVDRPVVFILTSRSAPLPWCPSPRWHVQLDALGWSHLAAVASDAVGAGHIGPRLRALLEQTCEGSPLYAELVMQALAARGRLVWEATVVDITDSDRPLELPPGLDGLIAARVDALPARLKAVLQLAATIGPRFSEALLATATGAASVGDVVAELAEHHLVRTEGEGQVAFVSSLVWEAVRRGILAARQRECHSLVATGILGVHRENLDDHRLVLAHHLAAAGRQREAAEQAAHAAARLEDLQHVHESADAWQTAIGWLECGSAYAADEAWFRLRAGETSALAGAIGAAERHLRIALELADESGLPEIEARAHLGLGLLERGRGRVVQSRRHLEAAWQNVSPRVAATPGVGWERDVAVRVSEALGRLLYDAGDLELAQIQFLETRRLAEGDAVLEARALVALALQPIRSGDASAALHLLDGARKAAEAGGDRILLGTVVNNIGAVHHGAGRYKEALACFREALDVRQGLGYREGVVTNLHNVGDTLLRMNEPTRAWASFSHARDLAREVGWARGETMNDVYLAYIDGARGEDDGLERLRLAARRAEELADPDTAAQAIWLAGRLHLERGEMTAAMADLVDAQRRAQVLGAESLLKDVQRSIAGLGSAAPA